MQGYNDRCTSAPAPVRRGQYGRRMSGQWPSWMPPFAGSEAEHLVGALDRMRATFRWKADGLDAAGLNHRLETSGLTIGGLLKHLARVEDGASSERLDGSPHDAYWDGQVGEDDPEFTTVVDDAPEVLYRLYDDSVVRARGRFDAAIADAGLDMATAMIGPEGPLSLRRLLFDLLEEYGRHTGHADLIREAIDGRVGEDPPADWDPFTA